MIIEDSNKTVAKGDSKPVVVADTLFSITDQYVSGVAVATAV